MNCSCIKYRKRAAWCVDKKTDLSTSENHTLCAFLPHIFDDGNVLTSRFLKDFSETEFIVDDCVNSLFLRLIKNYDFESIFFFKSSIIEIMIHSKSRSKESDLFESYFRDFLTRSIGNIEKWNGYWRFDMCHHHIHGIGCEEKEVCSGLFQFLSICPKKYSYRFPNLRKTGVTSLHRNQVNRESLSQNGVIRAHSWLIHSRDGNTQVTIPNSYHQ